MKRVDILSLQMLSKANSSPDYTNYLICILRGNPSYLGLSPSDATVARSSAAITLKNQLAAKYRELDTEKISYLRSAILPCLSDESTQVRNYVGLVIAELVKQGGVMGWPDVYGEIFSLAENEKEPRSQEGAVSAFLRICEDNTKHLNKMPNGQRPLDELLPRLYQLMRSQNPKVRALALECVNIFMPLKPPAILNTVDTLMSQVFQLATDTNDDVRRFVCRSLVQLVEMKPEVILPHMNGLVDYLITQQRKTLEPDVALEAAEFWLSIAEHKEPQLSQSLEPYLDKIVPTLLESMVYSEDDIARLEMERDDADEDDREQDIKPQFAKSKRVAVESHANANGAVSTNGNTPTTDLSDGEIEDDEDGDEDPEDEWNLRKCSAAALDLLASSFPVKIFDISLPYLKQNLQHQEWPNREAAVLAFGALADGCEDVVGPYLPELIPFLLTLLQDKEPVVRKITCWSLGRYTKWVIHLEKEHPEQMSRYLEMTIDGILRTMVDRNKSVQEGAASSFSSLEETAGSRLTPYTLPIVQQFIKCFDHYKDRNMFILYDCIQTLAESVGPKLSEPNIEQILMEALTRRWQKVSDRSRELFPLLECLSYVASAIGHSFSKYADPIFGRCISLVHQNLEEGLAASNNAALDKPDKDFLVTSLDLLSSMIQALPQDKSAQLVVNSQPKMFELLCFCMQDANHDVRQSSYALLGDCAIYLFTELQPFLPSILPVLSKQLDVNSMPDEEAEAAFAVINNACWSCGEIARRETQAISPFIDKIYERLYNIISSPDIPPSVLENAAIALGRLGLNYSTSLAPHLGQFATHFASTMKVCEATSEKVQAFMGYSRIIAQNPTGLGENLVEYLRVIGELSGGLYKEEGQRELFQHVRISFLIQMYCSC
jgi:transportin-1